MSMASLLMFLFFASTYAGSNDPEYEEIFISLHVDRLGDCEIPALIGAENEIYLSVTDVFNFLKIKITTSLTSGSASGFIVTNENSYQIDSRANLITYQKTNYTLNRGDVIHNRTGLFLKLDYFNTVFGLPCVFNFRNLTVVMHPTMELPAVRENRLEKMRENIRFVEKNFIADTTISKSHKLFHIGAVDWTINTMQQVNGASNLRVNAGIGATLAGGEVGARLNYNKGHPFAEKHQHYFWRSVNNNSRALRQITAGKIQTASISTILDYLVGVQITNTPTFQRASFGTFSYSNHTEPGWVVELYVNNLLVNYSKADASGFFIFNIPLSYGNTEAVLRCYGPWGEEKISRVLFNIPFNFLPVNEFEYKVSSGFVQDAAHSRFAQATMNYGVSRHLTVGGGIEYLSSVSLKNPMPFLNTSFGVGPNLLFTGEYVPGVRSKGKLSYLSPSDLQIELSHVAYEEGQTAVKYNYTRETSAALAKRFQIFNVPFFSRLALAQNVLRLSQFTNVNFLLSGSFRNASMNVATYALSRSETTPFIYTNVSSSFMMPLRTIISSQVRFIHNENRISFIQCSIKKNILDRATIHATYERDIGTGLNTFQGGFIYNFSFARLDVSTNHNKNKHALFVSASGSLTSEPSSGYHRFTRNQAVGRGGVILSPFLDLNRNGKKEKGEPKVEGLHVNGSGGKIEKNKNDHTTIISGLEPFTRYFIQLDPSGFESISWQLKNSSMIIEIEPNQLKLVEIPVIVLGEASGRISLEKNNQMTGMGRLRVNFYHENHTLAGSTISESDGFFSYMGLAPGKYYASIDSVQLNLLRLISDRVIKPFSIDVSEEGDVEDQLLFNLKERLSKP